MKALLLIGLVVANPKQIDRRSSRMRVASIALIAVVSIGNAWSAGHLIRALLTGHAGNDAGALLATGAPSG